MVDLMVIKPGGFPELVSIPRAGVVEGLMELIGGRYHFYSLPGTRYVVMHANRLHPEATAFVEGEHERFNFFGTIVLARVSSARGVETLNDADINNLNIITTEGPLQLPAMIERRSENHEGLNNKG
jgi:hypothetical protein